MIHIGHNQRRHCNHGYHYQDTKKKKSIYSKVLAMLQWVEAFMLNRRGKPSCTAYGKWWWRWLPKLSILFFNSWLMRYISHLLSDSLSTFMLTVVQWSTSSAHTCQYFWKSPFTQYQYFKKHPKVQQQPTSRSVLAFDFSARECRRRKGQPSQMRGGRSTPK